MRSSDQGEKTINVPTDQAIEAFNTLTSQRYGLMIAQCDKCRFERILHKAIEHYGELFVVIMNVCDECLNYNIGISKTHNVYWPKTLYQPPHEALKSGRKGVQIIFC